MNLLKNLENFTKEFIQTCMSKGLNTFFATLCVIDLFGVFPIVALPAAITSCGFYGIPLLLFVITVQIYTAVILGRCWVIAELLDPNIIEKSRYPYAAVAELVYGKRMRIFVTTLLNITIFGAGIPNILVASQNLQLIGERISDGKFNVSFCYWLLILGVILSPIMWFGSPKNMKPLASVSVVTVLITSFLIWNNILQDNTVSEKSLKDFEFENPNIVNFLKVYGMIAFQFDIHPMLMTIEVDMQEKHKIANVVCYGLSATCILSIITTYLTASSYGTEVMPNVLENLPKSNSLYFAIMLVTLQLCLSSAVGNSALFQHIEEYLGISNDFNALRCILRTLIVVLAVLIAEIVPKFDLVMGIIGGSLTGPLIFILPPLFYRKICLMEIQLQKLREHSEEYDVMMGRFEDETIELPRTQNIYGTFSDSLDTLARSVRTNLFSSEYAVMDSILSMSVIFFGLIATIASTYFNARNANNLMNLWSPCINNISFAMKSF